MIDAEVAWIGIGLFAQGAFSARFLLQWLLSERARRSLLPVHFWFFSLIGAVLLLAYASHQRDPVIALGQMVGLAIYLRNIQLLRRQLGQSSIPLLVPWLLLCALALSAGLVGNPAPLSALSERGAPPWMALGFIGQALFTGRFVVQLYLSERAQASVNPIHFWYLSMSGSLLLLGYALHTGDAVIILGQSFGMVVYLRNLMLIRRQRQSDPHGEAPLALERAAQFASKDIAGTPEPAGAKGRR